MASAIHISLNVSDFDRSTDFYRRFFGEPTKLKSGYAKFVVQEPEIHLALQPGTVSGPGALSHLGIRVDSAARVHEWQVLLNKRGLPSEEEKQEACCYALQQPVGDLHGARGHRRQVRRGDHVLPGEA
jgi:catechol 2,3-dioxygenase-like lactoylglutathione lyase family enzyme